MKVLEPEKFGTSKKKFSDQKTNTEIEDVDILLFKVKCK